MGKIPRRFVHDLSGLILEPKSHTSTTLDWIREVRASRSCLAAQMQKPWNLAARTRRWARWFVVLALLLLCGAACTAKIEGPAAGHLKGADTSAGPTSNQLICQPGLVACNGVCVNLQSESNNCGSCGTTCTAPAVCASGSCNTTCAQGYQKCTDSCVNLATDSGHCGSCDKVCDAGVPCYGGVCGCPEGVLFCQGQCYDPMSDSAHCGTCDTACSGGAACVDGKCACGVGEQLCGTDCSNLNSAQHCGSCDKACNAGEICALNACIPGTQACPNGLMRCGDACVDLQSTASACGSCKLCRATCSRCTISLVRMNSTR